MGIPQRRRAFLSEHPSRRTARSELDLRNVPEGREATAGRRVLTLLQRPGHRTERPTSLRPSIALFTETSKRHPLVQVHFHKTHHE